MNSVLSPLVIKKCKYLPKRPINTNNNYWSVIQIITCKGKHNIAQCCITLLHN